MQNMRKHKGLHGGRQKEMKEVNMPKEEDRRKTAEEEGGGMRANWKKVKSGGKEAATRGRTKENRGYGNWGDDTREDWRKIT